MFSPDIKNSPSLSPLNFNFSPALSQQFVAWRSRTISQTRTSLKMRSSAEHIHGCAEKNRRSAVTKKQLTAKRIQLCLKQNLQERENIQTALGKIHLHRRTAENLLKDAKAHHKKLVVLYSFLKNSIDRQTKTILDSDNNNNSNSSHYLSLPLANMASQLHLLDFLKSLIHDPTTIPISLLNSLHAYENQEKELEQRLWDLEKQIVYQKGDRQLICLSATKLKDLIQEIDLYCQDWNKATSSPFSQEDQAHFTPIRAVPLPAVPIPTIHVQAVPIPTAPLTRPIQTGEQMDSLLEMMASINL